MSAFSISDAAGVEIASIVKSSGCVDPVISLCDEATLELPARLKSAVLYGMSDKEHQEVRQRTERLFEEFKLGSLQVGVFERLECRPEDLSRIHGFTLAMTVPMWEALSDYSLTYIDGRFALVGPEETVFNLRSVKTLAKWFT